MLMLDLEGDLSALLSLEAQEQIKQAEAAGRLDISVSEEAGNTKLNAELAIGSHEAPAAPAYPGATEAVMRRVEAACD